MRTIRNTFVSITLIIVAIFAIGSQATTIAHAYGPTHPHPISTVNTSPKLPTRGYQHPVVNVTSKLPQRGYSHDNDHVCLLPTVEEGYPELDVVYCVNTGKPATDAQIDYSFSHGLFAPRNYCTSNYCGSMFAPTHKH